MIRQYKKLIPLVILVFCVLGCSFLSGAGDKEVIYAPTEVGTPEGDKVTKDIGPAGGTLASPDGRMTLTVPPNALTESIAFSMQPITNKAGGGIGLAYRLEPNEKTFTTPLEIAVRYDEQDLEGTVPEALSLAYQDQQGAWRAQKSAKLDRAAKTLTMATTHFTDVAFLSRLRLSPAKATLYVGESQYIEIVECEEPGFIDKILSRPAKCSAQTARGKYEWELVGEGKVVGASPGVTYIAPAKKPTPNTAYVGFIYEFLEWDSRGHTNVVFSIPRTKITIIDRGYRATGQSSGLAFSGVICSLEKPFTVSGESMLSFKFNFTPSSENAGKVDISGSGFDVTIRNGGGTYTVEGIDSDRPRLALTGNFTGTHPKAGSATGSGTRYIDLVPLDTDECGGEK